MPGPTTFPVSGLWSLVCGNALRCRPPSVRAARYPSAVTRETTARPWLRVRNTAAATALMEAVGLIVCGFITLILWWIPPRGADNGFVAASAAVCGLQPAVNRLRQSESPRPKTAVALALLAWGTVAVVVALAVASVVPASAHHHVDLLVGWVIGMPAGSAVLSWSLNRATG